jgi:hypothetical protein
VSDEDAMALARRALEGDAAALVRLIGVVARGSDRAGGEVPVVRTSKLELVDCGSWPPPLVPDGEGHVVFSTAAGRRIHVSRGDGSWPFLGSPVTQLPPGRIREWQTREESHARANERRLDETVDCVNWLLEREGSR